MCNLSTGLKIFRKNYNITQKEAAIIAGVTERNYQRYENDTVNPPASVLIALANYFNVSLDYLVGRSDKPQGLATGSATVTPKDEKHIKKYHSLNNKEQEMVNNFINGLLELKQQNPKPKPIELPKEPAAQNEEN